MEYFSSIFFSSVFFLIYTSWLILYRERLKHIYSDTKIRYLIFKYSNIFELIAIPLIILNPNKSLWFSLSVSLLIVMSALGVFYILIGTLVKSNEVKFIPLSPNRLYIDGLHFLIMGNLILFYLACLNLTL